MAELTVIHDVPPLPSRPTEAHKGTFGTVIVVGGCSTMIGAPALCAGAVLRAGAGLVKLAVPASILPAAITIEPSATGIALSSDVATAVSLIDDADPEGRAVLAVGPGMGKQKEAGELVMELLRGGRLVVLDADGLTHLAGSGRKRPAGSERCVLTPHPGEFKRLAQPLGIKESPMEPEQRPKAAAALAEAHRAVVVLKGHRTVVCDGRRVYVNNSGNPVLATAGSGDLLTGLIAGLCAQGMEPFDAAVLGVYLHGLAADIWASQFGSAGLTARDLANVLPQAFGRHPTNPS